MSAHALPTSGFSFEVLATSGAARRARFTTPRAVVETPVFMPVGTQASVKGLTPAEVESTGARIILANTYHLWLRPGPELVDRFGGTPRFMGWPHAMLTDSGGFQVFSLASRRKIDDDGVTFRSHLTGEPKRLTPEESMRVQRLLRSDVAMVLDVCPPGAAERREIEQAMRLTTAWASRCLAAPAAEGQARFGIVQGGVHEDLRRAHMDDIGALPFDGLAMGGFSVGEPIETMYALLETLGPAMPSGKPRYLMGVGTPYDLIEAVGSGIDLFDCVLPTRNARNGQALTWHGRVNIKQARHTEDDAALSPECGCSVCATFSRGYLRHLYKANEMLLPRLLTQHNLHFYGELMRAARAAIEAGDYASWAAATVAKMRAGDEIDGGPPG
ncbi:MAG: tRNA guanosine(34) transglycosylase Tgt [Sandaracinaceae bacterium]|nr:tRNA guanosine(34) transglycosylase Tgt [Myxococcales bacterium]MCB9661466.1 tRNA guanosine(34) transglycosylase Tgt [Sandaracinaceae bacterium]